MSSDNEINDHAATEKGRRFFARPWAFLLGAPSLQFLPSEGPVEVAFAGRSNVGKSSLINALFGRKGLARTSNTPGRTQELNYFVPEDSGESVELAVVDMPGYGYAKAPKAQVEAWTRLVFSYLRGRSTLRRVFVLIDSRHGLKPNDIEVLDMLDAAAVSYQIVLTKIDKIKKPAFNKIEAATLTKISKRPAAHPDIISTSSEKNLGMDSLRREIADLA